MENLQIIQKLNYFKKQNCQFYFDKENSENYFWIIVYTVFENEKNIKFKLKGDAFFWNVVDLEKNEELHNLNQLQQIFYLFYNLTKTLNIYEQKNVFIRVLNFDNLYMKEEWNYESEIYLGDIQNLSIFFPWSHNKKVLTLY